MLQLATILPQRPAQRTVDEYVPLRVEFRPAPSSIDEALYWRATAPDRLLEVKLDARTGALAALGLILVPPGSIRAATSFEDLVRVDDRTEGHPGFATDGWAARMRGAELVEPSLRRIDEDVPFELVICGDGVVVLFDGPPCSLVVSEGDARFCFDEARTLRRVGVRLSVGDVAVLGRTFLEDHAGGP